MQLTMKKNQIPAGVYDADYLGGEIIDTKFGESYKIIFRVVGGEYHDQTATRLVNPESVSPRSNIAKFFAALAGVSPQDGLTIDDTQYVGQRYRISVEEHGNDGYTRVASIVERVQVAPPPQQPAPQPAQQPAQQAPQPVPQPAPQQAPQPAQQTFVSNDVF